MVESIDRVRKEGDRILFLIHGIEYSVPLEQIEDILNKRRLDARVFGPGGEAVGTAVPFNRSFRIRIGNTLYDTPMEDVRRACQSPYQPYLQTLILLIDCYHKVDDPGTPDYMMEDSILNQPLDAANKDFLNRSRQQVLRLLKEGGLFWQHADVKDIPFNKNLGAGEDFGMDIAGQSSGYMPAFDRYDGDLYLGLSSEGKQRLLSSGHHVLIISGLYGLLCPLEPVQLYDCILEEHNENYRIWRENSGLTRVLADYIQVHGINRLFDFTGVHDYRTVIDWDLLKQSVESLDILHCYYKYADGPKGLRPIGKFIANQFLDLSPEVLSWIQPGSELEPVIFSGHHYRTDMAEKRPLPANWMSLDLDAITDPGVKQQFESAENLLVTLYQQQKPPLDSGSQVMVAYAKGLEKMLHYEIARRIRACFFASNFFACHANDDWYIDKHAFTELPKYIKNIGQAEEGKEKQISLGEWAHLRGDLWSEIDEEPNHESLLAEILDLIEGTFGDDFTQIEHACSYFSNKRGSAAHHGFCSLDDLIDERSSLIGHLNDLIYLLYSRHGKPIGELIEDAQHAPLVERLDAILTLGRRGDPAAADTLAELLGNQEYRVRGFAAIALGQLGDESVCRALQERLAGEGNKGARKRIGRAIALLECCDGLSSHR